MILYKELIFVLEFSLFSESMCFSLKLDRHGLFDFQLLTPLWTLWIVVDTYVAICKQLYAVHNFILHRIVLKVLCVTAEREQFTQNKALCIHRLYVSQENFVNMELKSKCIYASLGVNDSNQDMKTFQNSAEIIYKSNNWWMDTFKPMCLLMEIKGKYCHFDEFCVSGCIWQLPVLPVTKFSWYEDISISVYVTNHIPISLGVCCLQTGVLQRISFRPHQWGDCNSISQIIG